MKIALASAPFPTSLSDGLLTLERLAIEAASKQAEIICFPESYLPGYPGMNYPSEDRTNERLSEALNTVCKVAADNSIAIIVPMDWHGSSGLLNLAYVVSSKGGILGYQTKNQLDPSEDHIWVPGTARQMFEVNGVKFGITICHEGFRYPESTRWAAQQDAKIVFHPHFTGSNTDGLRLKEWGNKDNPYYEKAMMMRALENTIYFASVNYASAFPDSASAVIAPDGTCVAHEAYGRAGLLIAEIDPGKATGLLAKRFKGVFPTQYSLLSAQAVKDKLEKQYGFKDMHCRLLIHNVGDTYLLENASTKYIFRIYRDAHRKLEEIKGELELLNLLHDGAAKVAYPINDLAGKCIQTFNAAEGTRYGVLFSYARGEVKQEMSVEQLTVLGREMARVHLLTANLELSHPRHEFNVGTTITDPLIRIKPAFAGLETEYTYLLEISETVITKLTSLDPDAFGYGYCHYDFLPKNFHFSEQDEITFFDFDFAGKGYLINDLASFYAHYFLMVLHGKMTQEAADRAFSVFVAGYRSIRPISQSELDAIPYFGFAWWIFYFGFHYDNFEDWSNFFFGPRFIKERVELIRKWCDYHGISVKKIRQANIR